MSLESFRAHRVVSLSPETSAYEAARAMADNHVGAVLVIDKQQLVGIVTDRDLALRVVGNDLLAGRTRLAEIMSTDVASVDVRATADDAAHVMRRRGCRRIPLTDGGAIVGIVTLDDLVVHGLLDAAMEREAIEVQLEAGARHKPEGDLRPRPVLQEAREAARSRAARRHEARAEAAYVRLVHAVQRTSGVRAGADRALVIVTRALCRRMTPEQARHFIAQLPSKLHGVVEPRPEGPDRHVSVDSICAALGLELGIDEDAAYELARAVCAALEDSISEGEINAARSQLPAALKALFPPPPAISLER